MSFLNWFSKKSSVSSSMSIESSGLGLLDATVPFGASAKPRGRASTAPTGSVANRKGERLERREMLYAVVRDVMIRAGVLSSTYKFKVLSLDSRGRQYLIMMDMARQYAGETARLSEIESLIAQHAKTRYDILVTAVYWRVNEYVSGGVSPVSAPMTVVSVRPAVVGSPPSSVPNVAATLPKPSYEPLQPEEVVAFKNALASVAAPGPLSAPGEIVRSGRRNPAPSPTFDDTEFDDRPSPLSGTQYGDL